MSEERLRLGVAGCGVISRLIFEECKGLDSIELVAANDPDGSNLEKFASQFRVEIAESFETLMDRPDVDAVVLTAPPRVRFDQAKEAAGAGKAIFMEKPLALSVAEGRELIEECHRKAVPLMVGHVLRYFPTYSRLAERVHAGDYGAPLALQVTRCTTPFRGEARSPWRLSKASSGGLLFELHVHEFDLARHLCGDPERVFCVSNRVGVDTETDYKDLYVGVIEFANDVLANCHFSQVSAKPANQFTVVLEKGTVSANFQEATQMLWGCGEEPIPLTGEDTEPPYRREIRLFSEAVLAGEPMPIPGEDGLWAVAMAESFEKAAETGQPVSVREVGGF